MTAPAAEHVTEQTRPWTDAERAQLAALIDPYRPLGGPDIWQRLDAAFPEEA